MQTVYFGNTLINDVMLGSNRMSEVTNTPPTLVTSSLRYYYDASVSASAANWRAVMPYTGSSARTGSLTQTTYTSTYPQSFNLTGSVADINFGGGVPNELTGSGPYTIQMFVKPVNDTGNTNLFWYGSVEGNRVEVQMSGSIGGTKFLRIQTGTSASVATNCVVSLNEYHQIVLTTDGSSTFAGFNLWVDNVKQSISGSTANGVPTDTGLFWVIGTINSQRPLSGSVISHLVYNRKLSDSEILQNYDYFQTRIGNI
jgi:Concanavalin A-like lectin/glucanases superfamily